VLDLSVNNLCAYLLVWVTVFQKRVACISYWWVGLEVLCGSRIAINVESFSNCKWAFGLLGVKVPIYMSEFDPDRV